MSGTPKFKVYADNEYVAACKHAEDAAMIAGGHGEGYTVRYNHKRVIWREGHEQCGGADSVDFAAETMHARLNNEPEPTFPEN